MRQRLAVSLAVAASGLASSAWSQTVTASWNSTTGGTWTDPTKWSTNPFFPDNGNPAGTDYHVYFTAPFFLSSLPIALATDITITRLSIDVENAVLTHSAGTLQVTFTDLVWGRYRIEGGSYLSPNVTTIGNRGTFEIRSGSASISFLNSSGTCLASGGTLNVGSFSQTFGNTQFNGAEVTLTNLARIAGAGSATLSAGALNSNSFQFIGNTEFQQSGGIHRAMGELEFGQGAKGVLSGGNLELSSFMTIGSGGTSSFSMNGAVLHQAPGFTYVATGARSDSDAGIATLVIDGSQTQYLQTSSSDPGYNLIGVGSNAQGEAIIRNSAVAELGRAEVGLNHGHGTLRIESGAQVLARYLRIGYGSWFYPDDQELRGNGTVILSGNDTFLRVTATEPEGIGLISVGTSSIGGAPDNGGTFIMNGGRLELSGNDSGVFRVNSRGSASFNGGSTTASSLQVFGPVDYSGGSISVGSIQVSSRINLSPGNNKTLHTGSLIFSGNGKIDLSDNAMIDDYDGESPLTQIRGFINTGYNAGGWNGNQLTSSAAAANPGHALGYVEASAIFTSFPASFGGYDDIDDTAILIRYTRYGDANLDGLVNLEDFNRLAGNFGTGTVWSQGEFNYDAVVNLMDFNLLAVNFGLAALRSDPTPADWSALAAAVPEPLSFTLAALALLLPPRRLRRQTSTHARSPAAL